MVEGVNTEATITLTSVVPVPFEVVITVQPQSISAIGMYFVMLSASPVLIKSPISDGEDFSAAALTYTFMIGQSGEISMGVPIVNDDRAEKTETFSVSVTSTNPPSVQVTPPLENIEIVDDESKR